MGGTRKERSSDRPNPTAIQRASLAIRTSDGENWSMVLSPLPVSLGASASRKSGRLLYLWGWFLCDPLDWLDVTPSLSRAQLGTRRCTPHRDGAGAPSSISLCVGVTRFCDREVGQTDETPPGKRSRASVPTWTPWSKRS